MLCTCPAAHARDVRAEQARPFPGSFPPASPQLPTCSQVRSSRGSAREAAPNSSAERCSSKVAGDRDALPAGWGRQGLGHAGSGRDGTATGGVRSSWRRPLLPACLKCVAGHVVMHQKTFAERDGREGRTAHTLALTSKSPARFSNVAHCRQNRALLRARLLPCLNVTRAACCCARGRGGQKGGHQSAEARRRQHGSAGCPASPPADWSSLPLHRLATRACVQQRTWGSRCGYVGRTSRCSWLPSAHTHLSLECQQLCQALEAQQRPLGVCTGAADERGEATRREAGGASGIAAPPSTRQRASSRSAVLSDRAPAPKAPRQTQAQLPPPPHTCAVAPLPVPLFSRLQPALLLLQRPQGVAGVPV